MEEKIKNIIDSVCEEYGGSVIYDEPLSRHSTISIGGPAAAWYSPSSIEELIEALNVLGDGGARIEVIGNGSNTLMSSKGVDAVFVDLGSEIFVSTGFNGCEVVVGAGKKLSSFISECSSRGFSGMEGLVGIPGTVGGALVMNAGYKSAISDRLVRVKVIDPAGRLRVMEKDDIVFGYRTSSFSRNTIILEASFRLEKAPIRNIREMTEEVFKEKLGKQPLEQKTLGCVFKNPSGNEKSSGELIDAAGLKGAFCGGAVISDKHANFIVNSCNATSDDVKDLIQEVSKRVKEVFGVELELEIRTLN